MTLVSSLPHVMLICDYQFCGSTERWCEALQTISNKDWNNELAVQVRIKNQSPTQYHELAELAKSMLPSTVRTLLNGDAEVAAELGYDGVHLPQSRLKTPSMYTEKLSWVSVAIHATSELDFLEPLGAHSIVVAPVFRPQWKAGTPLGLSRLRALVVQSSVPVYALGGIDYSNVDACKQQHVYGIAVLSSVLKARDPVEAIKKYLACFALANPLQESRSTGD
ncbi:MAG: thiamine phosphate synthase [Gammaproteobacteria bacterium]|nr:thiamine phosphate synthase [Gammaproteobacteria bacterium]MYF02516.1 thiamine phosphate synthase [Gammaproteobacteria bacterium]MYI78209.1 thiamine phosphate synthase [Gammaproteobacteria bacterium]